MKKLKGFLLFVLVISIFGCTEGFATVNETVTECSSLHMTLLRSHSGGSSSRSSSHSSSFSHHSSFGSSSSRSSRSLSYSRSQSSSRSNKRARSITSVKHSKNGKMTTSTGYYYSPYYGNFYGRAVMSDTFLTPMFCLFMLLVFCFYVLFLGTDCPSYYKQQNKCGKQSDIAFDTGVGIIGGFLFFAIFFITEIDELYLSLFDVDIVSALVVSGMISIALCIYLIYRQNKYFKLNHKYTLHLRGTTKKGLVTLEPFDIEKIKEQAKKECKNDFKLNLFLFILVIVGLGESIFHINYVALFCTMLLMSLFLYQLYYNRVLIRSRNYHLIKSMNENELKQYLKEHGDLERGPRNLRYYNL